MPAMPDAVEHNYDVRTRGERRLLKGIADFGVGEAGELVFSDAAGGCVAIIAAGEWLSVVRVSGGAVERG